MSLLAYGGTGRDDQQAAVAVPVSVTLVPAKVYLSASVKAAADGPDDASISAAEVPGTVNGSGAGADADAPNG